MKSYKISIITIFYAIILLLIIAHFRKDSFFLYPCIENLNLYIRELRCNYFPSFHQPYDNYLQLLPGIILIGMKAGDVKGRFNWSQLLVFMIFSIMVTQLIINGLKLTAHVMRPDGTNFYSFPSGHTTAAFMTATLLYKQYGFRSRWIGIVAYACAAITGLTRILNNRHWLFDVIVGAALAILLTEAAYRLTKVVFKKNPLNDN